MMWLKKRREKNKKNAKFDIDEVKRLEEKIRTRKEMLDEDQELEQLFMQLQFIYPDDKADDKAYFSAVIKEMMGILGQPFHQN